LVLTKGMAPASRSSSTRSPSTSLGWKVRT
jgi:hypothetical protein